MIYTNSELIILYFKVFEIIINSNESFYKFWDKKNLSLNLLKVELV